MGHNTSIADGQPSPPCQNPACHRRAQYLYRHAVTGLRVFRPWCRVCRGTGTDPGEVTPRPRVYTPVGQAWPDDIRCPFCSRAREPRTTGTRRATCRTCRDRAVPVAPAPPPVVVRRRKRPKPHRKPVVARPTAPTFTPFVFQDAGKRHEVTVSSRDQRRLRTLFDADAGHYAAATHVSLSRRYPTAMISALWTQWAALQE